MQPKINDWQIIQCFHEQSNVVNWQIKLAYFPHNNWAVIFEAKKSQNSTVVIAANPLPNYTQQNNTSILLFNENGFETKQRPLP